MAQIKRIQLRGISRNPSDRMTEDGGVAESLNVYLDNTEVAPMIEPKDVTSSLNLQTSMIVRKAFIHKTAEYSHLITHENDELYAYYSGRDEQLLLTFPGETFVVKDITAIGNILIVTGEDKVAGIARQYYLLGTTSKYKFIGEEIPVPHIQFESIGNDDDVFQGVTRGYIRLDLSGEVPGRMAIALFDKSVWSRAARGTASIEEQNTYLQEVKEELWSAVQALKEKIGRWGYFSCPRLVRYAVRLYDGSYIHHSVPILIGPGAKEWVAVTGSATGTEGVTFASSLEYQILLYYRTKAKLIQWDVTDWEDIISGVDIFISTDITFPEINADFETCDAGGGKIYFKGYNEAFEKTKQEILSKVNFYKIASIAVNDLQSLKEGIDLHVDNDVEKEENLVLRDRLTSDYMSSHKVVASSITTFNNRLLINAGSITLPSPYSLLNGLFCDVNKVNASPDEYDNQYHHEYRFYIRRNNGEEFTIMARNPTGGTRLNYPLLSNGAPSILETTFYARPMAWIAYPDPFCYKVEVYLGGGDIVTIPMYQHPGLNCSYGFVGLDLELFGNVAGDVTYDYSEKKTYKVDNQVMLSQLNNPFVFPVGQRLSLQAPILGLAIATRALSQGQFGQFPIYTFTEDGVFALETANDGRIISQNMVTRDVCVNPLSITPVDNSVVFVTSQGVMLLQGSQTTNISPFMNGKHNVANKSAINIIKSQDNYDDLIPALTDETHFFAFVKEAFVTYDYPGRRLLFMNINEEYQYVYKLDTNSWHKCKTPMLFQESLNSYPDSLVLSCTSLFIYIEEVYEQRDEDYPAFKEIVLEYFPNLSESKITTLFNWGEVYVTKSFDTIYSFKEEMYRRLRYSFAYDIDGGNRIFDLTTRSYEKKERNTLKGVITTRPFDLDHPDVKKSIKDIRVRGQFPKGAVKFILEGSDDGENFFVLSSLRGKSWKLFRLTLLCDLAVNDRISWVDVEYETRFENRLR